MKKKEVVKMLPPRRVRQHGFEVIELELKDIKLLKNPRIHPRREIEGIAESIKKYGFTDPVHIALPDNVLIEGYARYEAVKSLKLRKIRAIVLDIAPNEYYAVMILGNRLAEMGSWNYTGLMEIYDRELKVGDVPPPDLGFSVEELNNILSWEKDAIGSHTLDLTDFVEVRPRTKTPASIAHPGQIVEVVLTISKAKWEQFRVELESDLVSLAEKFEGLRYSIPKVRNHRV